MLKHAILSRCSLHVLVISLLGAGLAARPSFADDTANAQAVPADSGPQNNQIVEDIVARVNDQIITESDYRRAGQQLEAEAAQQGLSQEQVDSRKKDLLRDLIDQQLLLSKGKEMGITGETELIKRLDEIRKQNHLASLEDLEKAAEQQHVSFEDFKANIRNSIITQQVVRDQVSRRVSISQKEVQNYYQAHESEFSQPESIHLSEILIPTEADANPAALAVAQAKAESIVAKLKGGASFEDLAKSASSGPTAAQGGGLGEFRRGMLAPQLEAKTFNLKSGEFTEPIRTKQGFVILKVTEHNAGGEATFPQVRNRVEEAVFMEHMQPALRQYLTKLREQAAVDIKPGFVDTGASPDEFHPTYSAYQPPGPKKKKKFQRTRFRGRAPAAAQTKPGTVANAATPASTPVAPKPTQNEQQIASRGAEKPGKKEKIRFGQAPRESLPPALNDATGSQGASVGAKETASATSPEARATNTDIHYIGPNGAIEADSPAPEKEQKTRFSSRPVVHKDKKKKANEEAVKIPAPTTEETATQKVQSAPLGLADHSVAKKKKKKGEKTRLAAKPKQPEQTAQPYMGSPAQNPPANQQPQPASGQTSAPPAR